jgi:type II secretory pathway component PulK
MAKAVADRWNVPEDIKRILVERMSEFLMAEPELAIDAARVLVQCEKQNLDAKKRKRAATARVQIQNILQSHVEGPAPDPEYIAWKQQRLLEQQNVVDSSLAQPLVAAVAEGQDQPEEPAAPLPGGEPRAPADRLGTAPIAPLAGALVRRKTRLLV